MQKLYKTSFISNLKILMNPIKTAGYRFMSLHTMAMWSALRFCSKVMNEYIFLMSSPESYSQKSQLYSISPTAKPDTINKQTNKSQTPLMLAVNHKHVSGVKHLLEEGADPNLANYLWETPLYKG